MILFILVHFVVIIQGTDVKNLLRNIASYGDKAADIVNSMIECEYRCPNG